jgi:hypothetical protein
MSANEGDTLDDHLDRDPRWKLVERIVATPGFAKSARLSSLLLFVTKESLVGRPEELREQLIGERVFGRSVGYDPRDDNIVRSHASRLRQRLDAYFLQEVTNEEIRVSIPRGSYVPLFERVKPSSAVEPLSSYPALHSAVEQHEVVDRPSAPRDTPIAPGRNSFPWLMSAVALLLMTVTGIWFFAARSRSAVASRSQTPTHRLWSAMFSKDHDTLVVPADSSLVLLKSFTGHSVSLDDYADGQYLSKIDCDVQCDPQLLRSLAEHRYTSVADLKFAVSVTHLPEFLPNRTEIRYARDLQLEDLKQKNLILIGSPEADPWLGLFEGRMNFVLNDEKSKGPLGVMNRRPRSGEQAEYLYDSRAPASAGYATITFLPNVSRTGNVLVVQGFTLAGTQAAAEFITNDAALDALLAPLSKNKLVFPHFEILLRTMDVNGTASQSTLLAYRLYP